MWLHQTHIPVLNPIGYSAVDSKASAGAVVNIGRYTAAALLMAQPAYG